MPELRTRKVSEQREYVKALYYGKGGTGKTTNLATLANIGRVLFVDAEAGIKRRPLESFGVKVENLEILEFADRLSFDEIEDALWTVKSDLESDADAWAGVVFDSGSEIGQAVLDAIVRARVAKAESVLRQRGKGTVSPLMADRFFTDRDDYQENTKRLRALFRMARDLPCHYGASFLERRDQDDKSKRVWIGPQTSPSLQGDMVGWHDVVGRTDYDANADLFIGTFRPEGVAEGKDRFGILPAKLVSPTMERLIGYVSGELEADTDPAQKVLLQTVEAREEEAVAAEAAEGDDKTGALARARAERAARAAR